MPPKRQARGAKDEFEILTIIVNENPDLKQRVINRIKALQNLSTQPALRPQNKSKKKQN